MLLLEDKRASGPLEALFAIRPARQTPATFIADVGSSTVIEDRVPQVRYCSADPTTYWREPRFANVVVKPGGVAAGRRYRRSDYTADKAYSPHTGKHPLVCCCRPMAAAGGFHKPIRCNRSWDSPVAHSTYAPGSPPAPEGYQVPARSQRSQRSGATRAPSHVVVLPLPRRALLVEA